MKNPFVQAAAIMAMIAAAFKENAYRDFYDKSFKGHVDSSTPRRPRHNPAGSKLARKAAEGCLGTMRGVRPSSEPRPCRFPAPLRASERTENGWIDREWHPGEKARYEAEVLNRPQITRFTEV